MGETPTFLQIYEYDFFYMKVFAANVSCDILLIFLLRRFHYQVCLSLIVLQKVYPSIISLKIHPGTSKGRSHKHPSSNQMTNCITDAHYVTAKIVGKGIFLFSNISQSIVQFLVSDKTLLVRLRWIQSAFY